MSKQNMGDKEITLSGLFAPLINLFKQSPEQKQYKISMKAEKELIDLRENNIKLQRIIKDGGFLCEHKWDEKSNQKITRGGNTVGNYIILTCTKCGDMKSHNFEI